MRKQIGDEVLVGVGYEFGAGMSPSMFSKVEELIIIDKRNRKELGELFGQTPPYEVLTYEESRNLAQRDFVTAHHVLEHCPDPIGALRAWLKLVRPGGSIYLSIPSIGNVCEDKREITPLRHLIMDHFFEADGEDFESRNHIPSFVNQWVSMDADFVWYASHGVKFYAAQLLAVQGYIEGHDIHWHTFSECTLHECLRIATHLEGMSLENIRTTQTGDELFIVATLCPTPGFEPPSLATFRKHCRARWDNLFGQDRDELTRKAEPELRQRTA